MSKHNNVNPGQYKVAGRQRQGENIVQSRQKQKLAKEREKSVGPRKSGKKRETS